MEGNYLDYDKMLEKALLTIAKESMRRAAERGLYGDHHFFITFRTAHKGVMVPEFLAQTYPESLTIILQHEFSNLSVNDKEFGVTLSFNNQSHHIIIPFSALVVFSDPSVNFSLTFSPKDAPEDEDDTPALFEHSYVKDGSPNIISLSDFMKKGKGEEYEPEPA